MNFLEKNLEDIIFETPNSLLNKANLPISGRKFRQVKLGPYGVADLITISRCPSKHEYTITIYELKKDKIDAAAFWQAVKYAKAIQEFYPKRKTYNFVNIEIVLLGNSIDNSGSFPFLNSVFENVHFISYSYAFTGLSFNIYNSFTLLKS